MGIAIKGQIMGFGISIGITLSGTQRGGGVAPAPSIAEVGMVDARTVRIFFTGDLDTSGGSPENGAFTMAGCATSPEVVGVGQDTATVELSLDQPVLITDNPTVSYDSAFAGASPLIGLNGLAVEDFTGLPVTKNL